MLIKQKNGGDTWKVGRQRNENLKVERGDKKRFGLCSSRESNGKVYSKIIFSILKVCWNYIEIIMKYEITTTGINSFLLHHNESPYSSEKNIENDQDTKIQIVTSSCIHPDPVIIS